MRKLFRIALLIILFVNSRNCKAQQDSLKYKVINYLIEKGELNETNNRKEYIDNVFIVNLVRQKNNVYNAENFLYKIGTHTSHSFYYLMLRNGNKYEFIDVKKLDEVLVNIINFSKEKKRSSEEILKSVEAILVLYQRNLKAAPWSN